MRETGAARTELLGDVAAAAGYVGQGRTVLGILKNQMRLGGLPQGQNRVVLPGGVVIAVSSVNGIDLISVFAPEQGVAQSPSGQAGEPPPEKGQYKYVVAALPNPVPFRGISAYVDPYERTVHSYGAEFSGTMNDYTVTVRGALRERTGQDSQPIIGTARVRRTGGAGITYAYSNMPGALNAPNTGGIFAGEVVATGGAGLDSARSSVVGFVPDLPANPRIVVATSDDKVLAVRTIPSGQDIQPLDWNGGDSIYLSDMTQIGIIPPADCIFPLNETIPLLPETTGLTPMHKLVIHGHVLPELPLHKVLVHGDYLPNTPLHKIRIWGYFLPNRPLHKIVAHGVSANVAGVAADISYADYSLSQGAEISYISDAPIGDTWNVLVSEATLVSATFVRAGMAQVFATGVFSDQEGLRSALVQAVKYVNALNDAIMGDTIAGYDAVPGALGELDFIAFSAQHFARMSVAIDRPFGGSTPYSDAPWLVQVSSATTNDAAFIPDAVSFASGVGMGALAGAVANAVAYVNAQNRPIMKDKYDATIDIANSLTGLRYQEYSGVYGAAMYYDTQAPLSSGVPSEEAAWDVLISVATLVSAPLLQSGTASVVAHGVGLPQLAAAVASAVSQVNALNDAIIKDILAAQDGIAAILQAIKYVDHYDAPVPFGPQFASIATPWEILMSAPTLVAASELRSGMAVVVAQGAGLPALAAALGSAVADANDLNTHILATLAANDSAQGALNAAWRAAVTSGTRRAAEWKRQSSRQVIQDLRAGILPFSQLSTVTASDGSTNDKVLTPAFGASLLYNMAVERPGPVSDWQFWLRALAPVSKGTYRQVPLVVSTSEKTISYENADFSSAGSITTQHTVYSYTAPTGHRSATIIGVRATGVASAYNNYYFRPPEAQEFSPVAPTTYLGSLESKDALDYYMHGLVSGYLINGAPQDSRYGAPSKTIPPDQHDKILSYYLAHPNVPDRIKRYSNVAPGVQEDYYLSSTLVNFLQIEIPDIVKQYRKDVPVLYKEGQTVSATSSAGVSGQANLWNDSALMPTLDEHANPPAIRRVAVTVIPFSYVKDGVVLGMFATSTEVASATEVEVYGAATYSYLYDESQFRFESWTGLQDSAGVPVDSKRVAIDQAGAKIVTLNEDTAYGNLGKGDTSRVKNCILQYGPIHWPDLVAEIKQGGEDPLVSAVRSVFNF